MTVHGKAAFGCQARAHPAAAGCAATRKNPASRSAGFQVHGCFDLVRFFRKLSAALVRTSLQQPGNLPARRHFSHV
jgi:hypothetical protein